VLSLSLECRPPQGVGEFYDLSVLRSYVSIIDQYDFVHSIVPSLPLLSAELHIRDYQYIGQREFNSRHGIP